jgi:hypothetical protein
MKFKNSIVKLVKTKGKASIETLVVELLNFCHQKFGETITDPGTLNYSVVSYLCNVVETITGYTRSEVSELNKKELVLRVYFQLFPQQNNDSNKTLLSNYINDLHANGGIKSVRFSKVLWSKLKACLK